VMSTRDDVAALERELAGLALDATKVRFDHDDDDDDDDDADLTNDDFLKDRRLTTTTRD